MILDDRNISNCDTTCFVVGGSLVAVVSEKQNNF